MQQDGPLQNIFTSDWHLCQVFFNRLLVVVPEHELAFGLLMQAKELR